MPEQRIFYRTVGYRRAVMREGQTYSWIFYATLRTVLAPTTDEVAKLAHGAVRSFALDAPHTAPADALLAPFADYLTKAQVAFFEVGIDDGLDLHMLRNEPAPEEKPTGQTGQTGQTVWNVKYVNPLTGGIVPDPKGGAGT